MKKLLLLLVGLPGIAYSQKLEFGINGGIIPYSYYKEIDQSNIYTLAKISQSTHTFGGKAMLNLLSFQVGVGFDYSSIVYTSAVSGNPASGITPSFGGQVENDIAFPLFSPYIFINRKIPLPKSHIYIGLNGGYATGDLASITGNMGVPVAMGNKFKGWLGGVQAGYTFYITSHLGINADATFRAIYMRSQREKVGSYPILIANSLGYQHKNLLLYLPTTIGIRYKL